tara:strand:- start:5036 stop:5278 length:243 start_codon:yes stop_codon:yes gene_type:complete
MEVFSPPNIILVNTKKLQEELKNKSFNNEYSDIINRINIHLDSIIDYITKSDEEITLLNKKKTTLQQELTIIQLELLNKK